MALVDFADQPRHLRQLKPVRTEEAKPTALDELVNRTVEIASAADYALKRIKPVLPGGNMRVIASPVLDK